MAETGKTRCAEPGGILFAAGGGARARVKKTGSRTPAQYWTSGN
jgi:hypothetical protein